MWDLPSHLQSLNTIPSPSSLAPAINAEDEAAFWNFMNTDELFDNFGVSPATHEAKEEKLRQEHLAAQQALQQSMAPPPVPAPTPAPAMSGQASGSGSGQTQAATLESFIAAFASGGSNANAGSVFGTNSRPAQPLPLPYNNNSLLSHNGTLDTAALLSMANFDFSTLTNNAFDNLPAAPAPTPASATVSTETDAETAEQALENELERERISGAKKLKSIGAGPAEIEEDKRRRNTEASARFRAKKKEREQALEIRAKELEAKLATLAAENASLSNENRLLKAIVLGSGQEANLQDALANASAILSAGDVGSKRKRED